MSISARKLSRTLSCCRGNVRPLDIDADEFHYFYLIKPNYRFPIDDRYGRALIAHIDQLFQSRLIGAHISFHELDALLR